MIGTKMWIVLFSYVIATLSAQEQNGSGDSPARGRGAVTSQSDDNVTVTWESWLPKVNATCRDGSLALTSNPACFDRKLNQTTTQCQGGTFKTTGDRECVTYDREIDCIAEEACSQWSEWDAASECCDKKRCDFNGTFVSYHHQLRTRSRICTGTVGEGCAEEIAEGDCIKPKAAGSPSPGGEGGGSTSSHPIRALIFGLAGMVMVGLLLFAVIRLRKVTAQKREAQAARAHPVEGVDNEALMNMPSESRVQTILNNMNANGHHYELRERSDSTPGRRVYVITPTGSPANHGSQHGRIFSRATSQLSSIAEESTDDALSRITEGTEPREDDCVFKYNSEAINEITNADSAFDEEPPKPASSTEAINCINDVIAMYDDVDNDANKELDEMLKISSVKTKDDFRMSGEGKGDEYLTEFGWRPPQERNWTVAKLKDESTGRQMSTSCSTLNSMYLSNMSLDSKETTSAVNTSDENISEPLLGNEYMTSSNLKRMKEFSSMPTILDTSQIPDVDQVIPQDSQL